MLLSVVVYIYACYTCIKSVRLCTFCNTTNTLIIIIIPHLRMRSVYARDTVVIPSTCIRGRDIVVTLLVRVSVCLCVCVSPLNS